MLSMIITSCSYSIAAIFMFQCKTKNVMLIKKKKKNIMNELYEMDLSLKIPNEKEMLTV